MRSDARAMKDGKWEMGKVQARALDQVLAPIHALVEQLRTVEQVEMPLTHHFAPGIYIREILMPAGTFVIGHVHKTRHFNIVLTGRATVLMDGVRQEIAAPCTFVSGAGVQKVLYIHEDMRWQTVHANLGDSTDVAAIEETLVELSPDYLAEKGGMTIDEFRMSINHEPKETIPCHSQSSALPA